MSPARGLLEELGWRGLVHAQSEGLAGRLTRGAPSAYVGFDPTGPSLHVGHLVQVFLLTHLQRAGAAEHQQIARTNLTDTGDHAHLPAVRQMLRQARHPAALAENGHCRVGGRLRSADLVVELGEHGGHPLDRVPRVPPRFAPLLCVTMCPACAFGVRRWPGRPPGCGRRPAGSGQAGR